MKRSRCAEARRSALGSAVLLSCTLASVFAVGCGSSGANANGSQGGTDVAGAGGAGTGDDASASTDSGGGSGASDAGDGSSPFQVRDANTSDVPEGGFKECTGTVSEAEGILLDMYVILDHTGSMGADCPLDLANPPAPNSGKWCSATYALAEYFSSASAMGNRAALQFMTSPNYVCTGGAANDESTPVVGLTTLPVNASSALITTLDTAGPTGGLGTRIEAALHGIADFTAQNQSAGRTMIGILITDGDPNGCDNDVNNLAQIAAQHLTDTGIKTFIIGMTGATLSNLEIMATAGGAPAHGPDYCDSDASTCHYWSVGDGNPVAFVDALKQIQSIALLPCQYAVPQAPAGQHLDPNLVNVTFTPGAASSGAVGGDAGDAGSVGDAGSGDVTLGRVDSEAACDAAGGGWYYDNPTTPTHISLCKSTCDMASSATSGTKVHIAYGCKTIKNVPH